MSSDDPRLDELVAAVCAGARYRDVDPLLVRRIGRRELAARRTLKEAVKETRNRIHQVGGAFLDDRPAYAAWLARLHAAAPAGNGPHSSFAAVCADIMRHHASTRERLPGIAHFYTQIFSGLPPIRHILDVACGLNPLALPWMPLQPAVTYEACDIYADMIAFLTEVLPLCGVAGNAFVHDLAAVAPQQPVDLVLALKILPTLEQIERGSALRLLRGLNTRQIVVSFPTRTIGGRNKGMAGSYDRDFRALV
ncbi:MAG TPA: 16S rRNA methyltransferase, partial [Roseiflexaceae bacterium]|nr:16S rRNA methyltransferase [Roseiflexaceae bacterium]